jgi:hypothetical protein
MAANELKFNHLILYSGALHLYPLRQTFIYKYYGAPHLLGLFNYDKHLSTNIMVLRTFWGYSITTNIYLQILWCSAPFGAIQCSRVAKYL